ncbi:MAG: glycine oxidase ThiO, partial [Acidobacteria bacterium]|nr:glycine oxidase ThiO [Acidobacteriota bacterium]
SVEIVDDRPVGMGATQASAGVLAPYIEAPADGPLLDLTARSLALFDDFVVRVSAESGTVVPYRRTGTLDIATDEAGLRTLRATSESLARRGVSALLLDADAARREEPHLGDGVTGGLLIDAHGFVAAGDLTRALVASARRHGAHLVEQSRVRRITHLHGDLIVDTDRGTLTADAVVLAAGSWSGEIELGGLPTRVPVRPIRGQLLSIAWTGTPLRRVTWSHRCYLVPWDEGTVLVGATVEDAGFDERTTVAGVRDLLDAACEIAPHAWTAGFLGARVGLRPATADQLPIIGASQVLPNLMYATGHYRNGVLLAPLTAQLVADAMLDGHVDPMLAAVSPGRFGDL